MNCKGIINKKDLFDTFKSILDDEISCEYCRELTKEVLFVGSKDEPQAHLCEKCFCRGESILNYDTPSPDKDILQLQKELIFTQFSSLFDAYFLQYETFKDDPLTQHKLCKVLRDEMCKICEHFDDFLFKGGENGRE